MRYEVQVRLAAFYLVSVFVGGFSSILAFGLMQMEGLRGYKGWRWIFVSTASKIFLGRHGAEWAAYTQKIIEGLITQLIAVVSWFLIIDFPDKARQKGFLTENETRYIQHRIETDRSDAVPDPLTWKSFLRHIIDVKLWVL